MNHQLMEQISQHVFANLGLISVSFVNPTHTQSIVDKSFRLPDRKLIFRSEGEETHRHIYGTQIVLGDKDFKILAGDCSQDGQKSEFCVIIQLTGMPVYGVYMVCDPRFDSQPLIAVSMNSKDWMPCSTFLQATLLAAMEQLRDIGIGWGKCANYQSQYEAMLSMINFHTNYYEALDEGQES